METFGEYLKAQREKKSIRLEEIASITKIHLHSLELLEGNDWGQLPPEPFIRGFILAYAKYVGLDPKETLGKYHESMGQKPEQTASAPIPTTRASQESPSDMIQNSRQLPWNKIFMGAGAVAVVILLGVFIYVGKKGSEPREIAETAVSQTEPVPAAVNAPAAPETPATEVAATSPSPSATPQQEVASAVNLVPAPMAEAPAPATATKPEAARTTAAATNATATAAVPAPASPPATAPSGEFAHEVAIEGQERTWIKVVIDDAKPIEYFLPKGEKTTYQAKSKIKVVLGNSAGAKVVHNGQDAKGKKFQGTIRYYLFPDNARFPQDVGSRKTAAVTKPEGEEGAANAEAPAPEGESKPE